MNEEEVKSVVDERMGHLRNLVGNSLQAVYEVITTLTEEVGKLHKISDPLYKGQLCANLMEEINRKVVENYFKKEDGSKRYDYRQPILKDMDKKIEIYESKGKKQKLAKKKWSSIKLKLHKAKVSIDFLEDTLSERNTQAHPNPLKKEELDEIAERLSGEEERDKFKKVIAFADKYYPKAYNSRRPARPPRSRYGRRLKRPSGHSQAS